MTKKQLKDLMKQGEGQTVEFKDDRVHPRSLAQTLTAFAAADGGVVLIGVADDGSIPGVSNFQRVRDNLIYEAAGRNHCEPQIQPMDIEKVETEDGKIVVAVTVPADFETIHSVAGKYFLRVGSRNEPLTPRELRRLMFSRGEVSFEALPCKRVKIGDLDEGLITRYIRRHEEHIGQALNLTKEELLINVGCARESDSKVVPTNAGVLLFHKEPQWILQHSQLLCVRFKGTDVIEYIDKKELRGSLPGLVDQAKAFIRRHTRMGGRIPGFQRIDYPEYPEIAFREAIVNAVIHRDWSLSGEFIRVFVFDDRIEVLSPGNLLLGITLEQIRQGKARSKLRNPIIVGVFDTLGGYIEKLGTGIRRMINAMKEHGLEPPDFDMVSGVFQVTLKGPGEKFMELAKKAVPEWMKGLNERQIKAIHYIQEKGKITNREYRELCGIGWDTAHRDLSGLMQEGIIKREGKGRATHYRMIIG